MTAGDLAVVLAAVLCSIGFAALIVVLMRVLDTMKSLRARSSRCARRPARCWPSCGHPPLRPRQTYGRGARRPRTLRPRARLCRGNQWRGRRQRPSRPGRTEHPGDQDCGDRHGHVPGGAPPAAQGRKVGMIKRITWFMGGAVAGVAGAGVAKRRSSRRPRTSTPRYVVHGATGRVHDAFGEGRRAMHARELELRGRLDGQAITLADIWTRVTRCWSTADRSRRVKSSC